MVRINIINPRYLTDQHLIAEYAEILMLVVYVKKYSKTDNIPKQYCLGTGHITFFKNKLKYLKRRHEQIKKEMKRRNFKPNKTLNIERFKTELKKDWHPQPRDYKIIQKRLIQKIKLKPKFYRYYGEHKSLSFLINLTTKK